MLFGMALSYAGFDIAPWQRGCLTQGGQLQPHGLLLERGANATATESQSQWYHPYDTESRSFLRVSQW
jgi:hypothetical protein